jgi:hypothetical protein
MLKVLSSADDRAALLVDFVGFLFLSEFIHALGSVNGIIVPIGAGRADTQAAR